MKEYLETLLAKQDLNKEQMTEVMQSIMSGQMDDVLISAFLIALRAKGESPEEISASARVMHELSDKVDVSHPNLVDIVGTGGDGLNTFNISTTSAFVACGAGAVIAKHGNRSASGLSGSADVLERAGIHIELSAKKVSEIIKQIGIGFMFAPMHHQAMKHAKEVRSKLGVRTIFNLLGPLTNPARARNLVVGVFARDLIHHYALCFKELNYQHVLVVHSFDGMDEISIYDKTHVVELNQGKVSEFVINPEDYGLKHSQTEEQNIYIQSSDESLDKMQGVLQGEKGPCRDIVILNAAAAIYAANLCATYEEGIDKAIESIDTQKAYQAFINLKEMSQKAS